ncbi:CotH kinase family protein [Maribellus sediminis]|uniref:CotH kinase family protein n=1 Tax=Maribellus sediminis TaxID=2696285 RepID=UPI0014318946|nr:CotH kinase family protein [Maribellus sediminis]
MKRLFFHSGYKFKPNVLALMVCLSVLMFTRCSEDEIIDPDDNGEEEVSQEAFMVAQVEITTENGLAVSTRESYVNCGITIESVKAEWNYSGTGKIRGRGNSTWLWYPKKPYRIKLDKKAGILGLDPNKDWVLLADYRDPTHLMNTFVFTVGQGLELPFTNHIRYAEVTLNNEYIGLYTITEQIEEGKNRVAIDSTHGILLSLDRDDGPELAPQESDNFWSSIYQLPVCIKHPDNVSSARMAQIKSDFAKLENAIKSADYERVAQELDISSFIDYMLIQELVYNVEVDAPRSIYLHKDIYGLWVMGPLWDFDAGFDFDWGTMYTGHNYFASHRELVLGTDPVHHAGGYRVPSFFTDLFRSKRFLSEYRARWSEIKDKLMSDYWTTTLVYADGFAAAMQRDADRWPIGKDNRTQISQMENWLTNRITYLTSVIENYPAGTIE